MQIAVVGPSPVPYVYGGAEGLMRKLTEAINPLTSHQAEAGKATEQVKLLLGSLRLISPIL